FIDFIAGLGPVVLGYGIGPIAAAMQDEIAKHTMTPLLTEWSIELAELFCEMVPCADMVKFLRTGADACSAAIRCARAFTGRERIVTLEDTTHGWHDWFQASRGNMVGIPAVYESLVYTLPRDDLQAVEETFHKDDNIAAVILEAARLESPSPGYLEGLRELTDRHGALLIFDEIITGFRWSPGGAQEYYGVVPDLATYAKAMSNGVPVSAVAGRRDVMDRIEELVTGTFFDDPVSFRGAFETLTFMRQHQIHDRLWSNGKHIIEGVNAAAEAEDLPLFIRGQAPVWQWTVTDPAKSEAGAAVFVMEEMSERGVTLGRSHNFTLWSLTDEDIAATIGAFVDVGRILRGSSVEAVRANQSLADTVRR
ncbi:MAG TPA: aminotransferase class III-fold pyridoxal phosphate-dependent enzyme, partial [Armatimonadota bacterium]|nr:aminotransferase class III-fold pyridoxal phosphate-dependent enzyme [Armatimonadota bacterium]